MTGVFIITTLLTSVAAGAQSSGGFPAVTAKAAILMDAESGRIIYGKAIHQRRAQASTTKMTTAILALEKGNLDKKITISKNAAETGESSIWLEKGEVLTLKQLIYAALLQSANDACVAIAEDIGGTEEKFVEMMNEKVREIGALDTHYTNPHGLNNPQHYSSAYDLAIIARYGLHKVPHFQEIVRTWRYTIPWAGHPWDRVMYNHNKLLKRYPGTDGVKTGFTDQAGKCLVSSATRNGHQFIAVVMDSKDIYADSAALLNYGFKNYSLEVLNEGGKYIRTLPVINGEKQDVDVYTKGTLKYPLTKVEKSELSSEVKLGENIKAPFEIGTKVGEIVYKLNNKVITKEDLIVHEQVDKKSFLSWLKELLEKAIKTVTI